MCGGTPGNGGGVSTVKGGANAIYKRRDHDFSVFFLIFDLTDRDFSLPLSESAIGTDWKGTSLCKALECFFKPMLSD